MSEKSEKMDSILAERRTLNGYDYTPVEQAKKEAALKQCARDFPDVPIGWREWVYDYIYKEVGPDEFERRMNSGYYEKERNE